MARSFGTSMVEESKDSEVPKAGPDTLQKEQHRSEAEVFADLEALCTSPGYVHALAMIHIWNDTIPYDEKLKPGDLLSSYSWSRLIRSELSTLFGLMIKRPIDYAYQGNAQTGEYVDRSFALLEELHRAMDRVGRLNFVKAMEPGAALDSVLIRGEFLREAMFYGAESAFSFQYIDLAKEKYQADNSWLLEKKGFTIDDAVALAQAIAAIQPNHIVRVLRAGEPSNVFERALSAMAVAPDGLADASGIARERVDAVIRAFSVPSGGGNSAYTTVSAFNAVQETPMLVLPDGNVVNWHVTSLGAALYEAPFFWMLQDKSYFHAHGQRNRGDFAEKFCSRRLSQVFGHERVFSNVLLKDANDNDVGEIDVLVRLGDRALIFQVKSKRLTIAAQSGIEEKIREDFQKGVQKAYDQAFDCAAAIQSGACKVVCADGSTLEGLESIQAFYPICVLSEHYPALAHQARHLIELREQAGIRTPFVVDIFMIDEMTEMLPSGLYFLSYVDRRVGYDDRVMASNEHVLFAYHLKQNLWLDKDTGMAGLMDDWGVELEVAMVARRTGVRGEKTPEGLLTTVRRSKLGDLIQCVENSDDPVAIRLGLFLLTWGEDAIRESSQHIAKIVARARRDQRLHDFSMGMSGTDDGLTVHCSNLPPAKGREMLLQHCAKRKYLAEKRVWFGVWIGPGRFEIRLTAELDYVWHFDGALALAASTAGAQMPYPPEQVSIGSHSAEDA
jgi:hypothetical protein